MFDYRYACSHLRPRPFRFFKYSSPKLCLRHAPKQHLKAWSATASTSDRLPDLASRGSPAAHGHPYQHNPHMTPVTPEAGSNQQLIRLSAERV